MESGKYIIETKAYDGKNLFNIRKVFTGTKKTAYEKAMSYAYKLAGKYRRANADFTVTIRGSGWRTTGNVHPM